MLHCCHCYHQERPVPDYSRTCHYVGHGFCHSTVHILCWSWPWKEVCLLGTQTAQKEGRVQYCEDFIQLSQLQLLVVLDNIVTMDESAMSYHRWTKWQSKQRVKKCQPGPIKAQVQSSRMKQMVLVFFNAKGVIYTNISPRVKLLMPSTSGLLWQDSW